MISIRIDKSAEDSGLAAMLADLLRQNVEQRPTLKTVFDALQGSIAIEAHDAQVSLTMDFLGGELVVYGGIKGKPDVMISTDSATVLELSNTKLLCGLPDLTDATGRAVLRKICSGELKITGWGLLLKPALLARLTKLLSVTGDPDLSLLPGETVLYRARPHWLLFFWPAILTVAGSGLLLAGPNLLTGSKLLFLLAATLWIWNIIKYRAVQFAVTNQRVLIKTGIVKRRFLNAQLAQIEWLDVEQGVCGGVLGYGTIIFHDASGNNDVFHRVAKPFAFRDQIQGPRHCRPKA